MPRRSGNGTSRGRPREPPHRTCPGRGGSVTPPRIGLAVALLHPDPRSGVEALRPFLDGLAGERARAARALSRTHRRLEPGDLLRPLPAGQRRRALASDRRLASGGGRALRYGSPGPRTGSWPPRSALSSAGRSATSSTGWPTAPSSTSSTSTSDPSPGTSSTWPTPPSLRVSSVSSMICFVLEKHRNRKTRRAGA